MKKIFLFIISLLIGIFLFSWVLKSVGWQEIKNAFLVFTGWQGMVILILTLFIAFTAIWKWKEILKGQGNQISFVHLFKLYLAGFSIAYLLPVMAPGGEVFRGYVLKEKNSVSWSKGIASIIIDQILNWTTNLVVIFFGMIFFLLAIGFPPRKLGIIFGGVFLILLTALSFFYFKTFKKESIAKSFFRFFNYKHQKKDVPLEFEKEIFAFFDLKRSLFWKGLALAFFEEVIIFLRTWLLIFFLGKNVGALPILSIIGFFYLTMIIPIPAAIGSRETVQVLAFSALGLGRSTGMVFTLIIRGAEIIFVLAGVFVLFHLGFKLVEASLLKKQNNNKIYK